MSLLRTLPNTLASLVTVSMFRATLPAGNGVIMAQDGTSLSKMDIPTFATSDDGTTHNQERQMSQGWRLVEGLGGKKISKSL